MKPQPRPISMLGIPSIVATWETYMLLPERRVETFRFITPYADPLPLLCTIPSTYPITSPVPYLLLGNSRCECYPCEPLPPFAPLPWPLLSGEVEIPQWRGKTTGLDEDIVDIINDCYWWTDSKGQNHSVLFRVDERPSPRLNTDGLFVWVWEADR